MKTLLIVLTLLGATATGALAQAPGLTPVAEQEVVVERYGLQIVVVDLAGTLGGGLTENPWVSIGAYLGAAPIVHMIHGNYGKAVASLFLRATLPYAGAWIGYSIEEPTCEDEFLCGFGGIVIGGTIGVVAASTIDAYWLAKETRPRRLIEVAGISADPLVQPTADGGVTAGLSGTF